MDPKKALDKAMAICAGKEYCELQIYEKLLRWQVTEKAAGEIIRQLVAQKFIDNQRYAVAFAKDKLRFNQWGRIKIRYELQAKRIESGDIGAALEQLDQEEYETILSAVINKKAKTITSAKNQWEKNQKILKYAAGKGFEIDLINEILNSKS